MFYRAPLRSKPSWSMKAIMNRFSLPPSPQPTSFLKVIRAHLTRGVPLDLSNLARPAARVLPNKPCLQYNPKPGCNWVGRSIKRCPSSPPSHRKRRSSHPIKSSTVEVGPELSANHNSELGHRGQPNPNPNHYTQSGDWGQPDSATRPNV
ncbi:hypothetical protein PtB15_1B834 [Puccinia triticina]|nr:hypothetical protein PtB15_1B834 [Puccinia triticina]